MGGSLSGRGRGSTCASTAIGEVRGHSCSRRVESPRPDASVCRVCEHMFVRWDELRVEAEDERTLPGYRDPAVVRTFDAPEALDTRFYEVRAKSALNRVPEKSRMPFRWTINPYRGCAHACKFCFARPTHKYLDMNARRDFEREIVLKG